MKRVFTHHNDDFEGIPASEECGFHVFCSVGNDPGISSPLDHDDDTSGMTGIFSQLTALDHALQGTQENHRVLSQNIANVNTPGYKTQRMDFDKLMQQLQAAGQEPEAAAETLQQLPIEQLQGVAERIDGNNVDLEREVGELKKNALISQAYTHLMASKLSTMRRAISG